MSEQEVKALRAYLAERDIACPGCRYNLRGLPGDACPECRQELRLTVGLAEPRIGALLACWPPLFAGAGAAAALLIFVLIMTASYSNGFPDGNEAVMLVWLPLSCFVSCGAAAGWLSTRRGRRQFRGLSSEGRAGVVAVAWALPAVWFIAFLALAVRHM